MLADHKGIHVLATMASAKRMATATHCNTHNALLLLPIFL
jgi:hypothetical protein